MRCASTKLLAHARVSSTASRPKTHRDPSSFRQYTLTKPTAKKSRAQPLRLTPTKIKVLSPDIGTNRPKIKKKNVIGAVPHNILCEIVRSLFQNATTATKTVIGWINAGSSTGNPLTLYPGLAQTEGLKGTLIEISLSSGVTRTIVVFPPLFLALNMEN